ncbi:hypothetical protein K438DRAFT_2027359 [Mycena galopus ATCC 62051]|nr:hypothetical protein K438DRAFT_2027359 [Mycena galopus ATCC 62051]
MPAELQWIESSSAAYIARLAEAVAILSTSSVRPGFAGMPDGFTAPSGDKGPCSGGEVWEEVFGEKGGRRPTRDFEFLGLVAGEFGFSSPRRSPLLCYSTCPSRPVPPTLSIPLLQRPLRYVRQRPAHASLTSLPPPSLYASLTLRGLGASCAPSPTFILLRVCGRTVNERMADLIGSSRPTGRSSSWAWTTCVVPPKPPPPPRLVAYLGSDASASAPLLLILVFRLPLFRRGVHHPTLPFYSIASLSTCPPTLRHIPNYEVELTIVIGRPAKDVSEADTLDYLLGYTATDDGFDNTNPLRPCLVAASAIPDPQKLPLKTTLNGTVMQDRNTADQIFTIRRTVAFLSQAPTLEPGSMIRFVKKPLMNLKHGDTMSLWFGGGIGTLTNDVVEEGKGAKLYRPTFVLTPDLGTLGICM